MATDKRGIDAFPHTFKQTTTADTWTEVLLPAQCNAVKLFCHNHDLIVGFSGCTDAAAVDDNVAFELDKHLLLDIPLGRGNSRHTSIFITTKTTGDEIRVMLIE